MRDQDGRHPEAPLHRAHRVAQLDADLGIQCAEGLVEQQHRGLVRERARDRDPLLLAAGELRRVAVVVALQRDQAQQLLAPAPALGGPRPSHAQRELDVVRDRHVAEQRVMLEHEAHATLARRQRGDIALVQ